MKIRSMCVAAGLALVVALGAVGSGCASGPQLTPKPLPAGVSFSGTWYSPQYDKMLLEQKGNKVIGTFSYKEGGHLEGELDGNILYFNWDQPGDFAVGRRTISGSGYLVMSDDGRSLAGRWGYDDDREGGGVWTADRFEKGKDDPADSGPIFKKND